jgi:endoribonuclease Dicer
VLHPVSRLSMWAQKLDKEIEYHMEKDKGRLTCVIMVDDKEKVRLKGEYVGRASQEELRFLAAEQAIQDFKLRDDSSRSIGRKQNRTKKGKNKRNTTAAA